MSCRCNFFNEKINFLIKSKEVKMQEIKKVGLMSAAKIAMLFGVLVGLIQGVLMGQMSMQYAREGITLSISDAFQYIAMDPTAGATPLFIALGWWSIIIAPILMGIGYFVSGIILAWLFNMFVKLVGGVKLEISEQKSSKKKK
jgi:hypothetical protein